MKLFLTGACGLVGRAIREAGDGDHQFVNLDITDEIETIGGVRGSITDRELILRATEGCDAIIHTAAMHGAFKDKHPNQDFIQTNVVGTENLFEAAIKNGIKRLVISSSLEVLCGVDWTASRTLVYDQNTPYSPDWIYPVTKVMVEELGHFHARENGLEVAQLRYVWVRKVPQHKIGLGLLARSIADSDVASINLLCCTDPNVRDDVFQVGPDTPIDHDDVLASFKDPWQPLERHWPGCTDLLKDAGQEPSAGHYFPIADIAPAKRMLGWQPQVTFDAYLADLGYRRK